MPKEKMISTNESEAAIVAAASTAASAAAATAALLASKVVVRRVESPVFQIAARIREIIRNGDIQPGMRLPSTRDLAAQLSVDPMAVHRALAQLTREGLVSRVMRLGTFVAIPPKKLERLAYYHRAQVRGHFGNFGRAVVTGLTAIGLAKGFSVEVISDTRPPGISLVEPHPELLRHARTRWVQGVIGDIAPEHVKWFKNLPVPHAVISNLAQPDTFNWSREEMTSLAVKQLAARGCRKIGFVGPFWMMGEHPDIDSYQLGNWRGLTNTLEELGLPINSAWYSSLPHPATDLTEPNIPRYGYDAIHRIFSAPRPDWPDGLYLSPDVIGHGVFVALALCGVRVPQDVQLVLHSNAEIAIFCPYPIDRLVVSAADAAAAMVAHIRNQLAGKPTTNRILPCHIETHNATPPASDTSGTGTGARKPARPGKKTGVSKK
ncbi:MAG: GntR family transcriptional regulator [Opitutaceae bacterium]|jgi:DNA-binding transcriptional regulator YhcF (GntR family)/DNA-binding LacI/PurR family transcriptional regulator|nr:GntR family transcriptional regulator [Opitutaceae bacterium]